MVDNGKTDPAMWMPEVSGELVYQCIGCGREYGIYDFIYTCPECGSLLNIRNNAFDRFRQTTPQAWRKIFDRRRSSFVPELSGIFIFHELILPVVPLEDIICLGEGQTPIVRANPELSSWVGAPFYVKNDGLNPSASFKDRGMASAITYLNHVIRVKKLDHVLGICASTGDTSAAAALYLSYLPTDRVQSVVLLPKGKVTTQQLSQPLASGAKVIEMPGVFDDCMRIVEELAQDYNVFLLNSKNPVRILGQKSYAFEVAQQLRWDMSDLVMVVPIGNAGNITAIMQGMIDLYELGIITVLPHILGVQSHHADPIARWKNNGVYAPVKVSASVAQAAMIGDPVSFPRVEKLVNTYFEDRFDVITVTETQIMEGMLAANRHGHVVCTQGGESIAGLKEAIQQGVVKGSSRFVVDSTSHQLKFATFQEKYFEDSFDTDYGITVKNVFKNAPVGMDANASKIAFSLGLKKRV